MYSLSAFSWRKNDLSLHLLLAAPAKPQRFTKSRTSNPVIHHLIDPGLVLVDARFRRGGAPAWRLHILVSRALILHCRTRSLFWDLTPVYMISHLPQRSSYHFTVRQLRSSCCTQRLCVRFLVASLPTAMANLHAVAFPPLFLTLITLVSNAGNDSYTHGIASSPGGFSSLCASSCM